MSGMPAEISVTQLAHAMRVPRHVIEYRLKCGTLATYRVSDRKGSKRLLSMDYLRKHHRELYDAVVRSHAED